MLKWIPYYHLVQQAAVLQACSTLYFIILAFSIYNTGLVRQFPRFVVQQFTLLLLFTQFTLFTKFDTLHYYPYSIIQALFDMFDILCYYSGGGDLVRVSFCIVYWLQELELELWLSYYRA